MLMRVFSFIWSAPTLGLASQTNDMYATEKNNKKKEEK